MEGFGGFDKSALGPIFGGYDVAVDDSDVLQMPEGFGMERTMLDKVWFNTGVSVASGAIVGGSYGFVEGLRQAGRTTFKLRMNAIINATSSRGRRVANRVGVLAIMATTMVEVGKTYVPDPEQAKLVTIAAGTATGILYNCTSGIRHTALGAVVGTGLMGAAVWGMGYWEERQMQRRLGK